MFAQAIRPPTVPDGHVAAAPGGDGHPRQGRAARRRPRARPRRAARRASARATACPSRPPRGRAPTTLRAPGRRECAALFVTGTDTGVGKTVVAAALAAALRAAGRARRRVQAGRHRHRRARRRPAARPRAARGGRGAPGAEVTPHTFGPAVSPHFAAELAGTELRPDAPRRRGARAVDCDVLVAEGVGGLLVPLDRRLRGARPRRRAGLPVVVAARPGLGTINHTLLTIAVARDAGLDGPRRRADAVARAPDRDAALQRRRDRAARRGRGGDAARGLHRVEDLAAAGASLPWRDVALTSLWPRIAEPAARRRELRLRDARARPGLRRGRAQHAAGAADGRRPGGPGRGHHAVHRRARRTCRWRASGRSRRFADHLAALDQWPGAAGVGHGAALAQLGLRGGGARPRAAPGRAGAARGARPGAAADHFVNSLGLGDPPSVDTIRGASSATRPALQARRRAGLVAGDRRRARGTGAVHTVDFKGRYGLEVEDVGALRRDVRARARRLPRGAARGPARPARDHAARGPHADARQLRRADPHGRRPRRAVAARAHDQRQALAGSARCATFRRSTPQCEERGLALYGGGMGELGVARGQVQLLASLFHPDGPNDIAPPGYNALDPAAGPAAQPAGAAARSDRLRREHAP